MNRSPLAELGLLVLGIVVAATGCQMTYPLTDSALPTKTETEASDSRIAALPKPGGLRRGATQGMATGLSDESRAIEERFGFR